jgi:hypothetical protein
VDTSTKTKKTEENDNNNIKNGLEKQGCYGQKLQNQRKQQIQRK